MYWRCRGWTTEYSGRFAREIVASDVYCWSVVEGHLNTDWRLIYSKPDCDGYVRGQRHVHGKQ